MRIFIMTDLEGVAGVADFDDCATDGRYYQQAKELLTEETNAACDGILDCCNAEIVVFDGHGCGGIIPWKIHPEARLLHGRPIPRYLELDSGYDAFFLLGHHAMNQTADGHLNHSYSHTSIVRVLLNREEIGEIGLNIYLAGWFNIPTVMVSGDQAACREAARYVWNIEQAPVKHGINRTCAISLSPQKARLLIREKAAGAIKKIKEIQPARISGPCELVIQYISSADATWKAERCGWEIVDATTVRTRGENYLEMWDNFFR